MPRAGQTVSTERKARIKELKAVLKSEFHLEVESVLFRGGQHFVDLQVCLRLPAIEEDFRFPCRQVPASPRGRLQWPQWVEEISGPGHAEALSPWLVKHWLEMGMLPKQLKQPL